MLHRLSLARCSASQCRAVVVLTQLTRFPGPHLRRPLLVSPAASDEFVVNRADVVRCLKAGAVAFQFMCYEDEPVTGPTGNRFDLWTTDPWELAADLAPEKVRGRRASDTSCDAGAYAVHAPSLDTC